MPCEQCIRESLIYRCLTGPPLPIPNEHITAPEDAMQIDFVPAPSGGYEIIVTDKDVFFRYFFVYPTYDKVAKTFDKVKNNIMTKHANLPTTFFWHKGSRFVSPVIKEVAGVLGITLKHAKTKHALTNGMLK